MDRYETLSGNIHSIETFGTVDGPGIRYVVFFQGCRMRCRYCHNPDTWKLAGGTKMTVQEILAGMERNKVYYEKGGLTCSGGEPLLQLPFLGGLLKEAKSRGIHTCLDTAGVPRPEDAGRLRETESAKLLPEDDPWHTLFSNLDLILMDFKHSDEMEHQKLTGHSAALPQLFAQTAKRYQIPMIARHVLVKGITDGESHLRALGRILSEYPNLVDVEVLPYHAMGEEKYEALGMRYPLKGMEAETEEAALRARETILKAMKIR